MQNNHVLSAKDIEPFLSPYLMGGWRKDNVSIKSVILGNGKIKATLKVDHYFNPADGVFHFTVPLAFLFIAQLGIIYGCIDNGLSEKRGEIFLREIDIQCRKVINKVDDLNIELLLTSKTVVRNGIYYIGEINIEENSMIGTGKYILPIK